MRGGGVGRGGTAHIWDAAAKNDRPAVYWRRAWQRPSVPPETRSHPASESPLLRPFQIADTRPRYAANCCLNFLDSQTRRGPLKQRPGPATAEPETRSDSEARARKEWAPGFRWPHGGFDVATMRREKHGSSPQICELYQGERDSHVND